MADFSRVHLNSLQFLNISEVTIGLQTFSSYFLPQVKEIFASATGITSLEAFCNLPTLRLLEVSRNEILTISDKHISQNLSILNLGETSPSLENYKTLTLLKILLQRGPLKAVNPEDINAVSCFQNFGDLAFGPADSFMQPSNIIDTEETPKSWQRRQPLQIVTQLDSTRDNSDFTSRVQVNAQSQQELGKVVCSQREPALVHL